MSAPGSGGSDLMAGPSQRAVLAGPCGVADGVAGIPRLIAECG